MLVTEKSGGLGGVVCLCVCVCGGGGAKGRWQKNLGDEKKKISLSLLVALSRFSSLSAAAVSSLSFLSLSLVPLSFSRSLVHKVPGDEQREERRQGSVDQPALLPARQAVCSQSVPLVLGEAGDLPRARAERGLSGAADGAAPVGGEVLEGGPGGHGVLGVLGWLRGRKRRVEVWKEKVSFFLLRFQGEKRVFLSSKRKSVNSPRPSGCTRSRTRHSWPRPCRPP